MFTAFASSLSSRLEKFQTVPGITRNGQRGLNNYSAIKFSKPALVDSALYITVFQTLIGIRQLSSVHHESIWRLVSVKRLKTAIFLECFLIKIYYMYIAFNMVRHFIFKPKYVTCSQTLHKTLVDFAIAHLYIWWHSTYRCVT